MKGVIHVNGNYKPLPSEVKIDSDMLFFMGYFIADGFARTDKGRGAFVSIAGNREDRKRKVLERFKKYFNEKYNMTATIYDSKRDKGLELRVFSYDLANWFLDWFGRTSKTKKIPALFLTLNSGQAAHFFKGYVTGDGYFRKTQVEWSSVSYNVAYGMCLIAINCGYNPTFRQYIMKTGNTIFIGCYTKTIIDKKAKYIYKKIKSVNTYFEKRPVVYDLTVKNNPSFSIGFSVAHNCHRIGQEEKVLIHTLVVVGSIDAKIMGSAAMKAVDSKQILDKEEK